MSPELIALLALGVSAVVLLLAVAGGVKLYPILKNQQQGYPHEAEVEAALLPYLFTGICGAYRLSEQSLDALHIRMDGVNKKVVADLVYTMLPDRIGNFDLTLVKALVPPDRFEQLVQDAFDRFDRFWVEHQALYESEFTRWQADAEGRAVHTM